jgi:hypothetical protein
MLGLRPSNALSFDHEYRGYSRQAAQATIFLAATRRRQCVSFGFFQLMVSSNRPVVLLGFAVSLFSIEILAATASLANDEQRFARTAVYSLNARAALFTRKKFGPDLAP